MRVYRVPVEGTPPDEPVTLVEAKAQLRVTHNAEDDLIMDKVAAAREYAETATRLTLVPTTWEVILDEFPSDGRIRLPFPPVHSVEEVRYRGSDGAWVVVAEADYELDVADDGAEVLPIYGTGWAGPPYGTGGVRARFSSGYGVSGLTVPAGIKDAILSLTTDLFENRSESVTGTIVSARKLAADRILMQYRVDL